MTFPNAARELGDTVADPENGLLDKARSSLDSDIRRVCLV